MLLGKIGEFYLIVNLILGKIGGFYLIENLLFEKIRIFSRIATIIVEKINILMDKQEIIKILNHWNFWDKNIIEAGIARKLYLEKLKKFIATDYITVILGARRSGKSFIMRQIAKDIIDNGADRKNILNINFEDPRLPKLDAKMLHKIYEIYLEYQQPKGKPYIFLDEVQEVENWEKWALMIKELNQGHVILSGSNAKLLSKELSTLLTGRHLDIEVYPLSFKEFLEFHKIEINSPMDISAKETEIKMMANKYLENGAFPEAVLSNSPRDIFLKYFNDIVEKDLIQRYKIRKTEKFKSLLKFYFSNISSLIAFTALEKSLKISDDTIEKFSAYLEDSYLLFFVKRFSFKVKEQEKSPRKVYAIDTGLSSAIGFSFIKNNGKLLENAVFLELQRRKSRSNFMEIYYWKNERHHEVDFVLKENEKVVQLIQVCYNIEDLKTKEREIRSLISAGEELKCDNLLVITSEYEADENISGKKIAFKPLYKFLLE